MCFCYNTTTRYRLTYVSSRFNLHRLNIVILLPIDNSSALEHATVILSAIAIYYGNNKVSEITRGALEGINVYVIFGRTYRCESLAIKNMTWTQWCNKYRVAFIFLSILPSSLYNYKVLWGREMIRRVTPSRKCVRTVAFSICLARYPRHVHYRYTRCYLRDNLRDSSHCDASTYRMIADEFPSKKPISLILFGEQVDLLRMQMSRYTT